MTANEIAELNAFLNMESTRHTIAARPAVPTRVEVRVAAPLQQTLSWDELMSTPTPQVRREVLRIPHVGTYTVVDRETEEYRTYKIREKEDELRPGNKMYVVGLLTGPDNESSYRWMAFVKQMPEGESDRIVTFKAYRDARGDRLIDDLHAIMGDPVAAAKKYGLVSGRCGICGRKLTVPESIAEGIGPVCKEKVVRR